jgi:hypothetical protein
MAGDYNERCTDPTGYLPNLGLLAGTRTLPQWSSKFTNRAGLLFGLCEVQFDGKERIVEYEPDPDLRIPSKYRSRKMEVLRRFSRGRCCDVCAGCLDRLFSDTRKINQLTTR